MGDGGRIWKAEIRALQRSLGSTTTVVLPDQGAALSFALVVMRAGHIEQDQRPQTIAERSG